MNQAQTEKALQIARSTVDLSRADDMPMYGLATSDFCHCTVTLEAAAKFLRWQCVLFNGDIDAEELNSLAPLLRRRVTALDA